MDNIVVLMAENEDALLALARKQRVIIFQRSAYGTLVTGFTDAKSTIGSIEDAQTGWVALGRQRA